MKTFEETVKELNKMMLEHTLEGLKIAAELVVQALACNNWEDEVEKYYINYYNYRQLAIKMIVSELYSDMIADFEYIPIRKISKYDYIKVTWKE